jgi:hypothetical protein
MSSSYGKLTNSSQKIGNAAELKGIEPGEIKKSKMHTPQQNAHPLKSNRFAFGGIVWH